MHRVQMFLLELFMLEHASYELQNTAGQKQPLKDIEKRKKTAEGDRKKRLPFSPSTELLSPCQVLTCSLSIYPQALPGKVNTTPFPP